MLRKLSNYVNKINPPIISSHLKPAALLKIDSSTGIFLITLVSLKWPNIYFLCVKWYFFIYSSSFCFYSSGRFWYLSPGSLRSFSLFFFYNIYLPFLYKIIKNYKKVSLIFFIRIFFIRTFFVRIFFIRIFSIRIWKDFYIINNIFRNLFLHNIFTFF